MGLGEDRTPEGENKKAEQFKGPEHFDMSADDGGKSVGLDQMNGHR